MMGGVYSTSTSTLLMCRCKRNRELPTEFAVENTAHEFVFPCSRTGLPLLPHANDVRVGDEI